jgi:hypothetical protein
MPLCLPPSHSLSLNVLFHCIYLNYCQPQLKHHTLPLSP